MELFFSVAFTLLLVAALIIAPSLNSCAPKLGTQVAAAVVFGATTLLLAALLVVGILAGRIIPGTDVGALGVHVALVLAMAAASAIYIYEAYITYRSALHQLIDGIARTYGVENLRSAIAFNGLPSTFAQVADLMDLAASLHYELLEEEARHEAGVAEYEEWNATYNPYRPNADLG